jgi:hypothetical protein
MKPILVLTIREHGMEDDIYVFANRNVNILPTIKEWCLENDVELDIPDFVTDSESFWQWYLNVQMIPDKAPNFFVSTHLKQLLDE